MEAIPRQALLTERHNAAIFAKKSRAGQDGFARTA
jgi:hypothetical protein